MHKVKILITGRSRDEIEAAEKALAGDSRCDTATRLISNGHVDPLHGLDEMPDLLVSAAFEDVHETDQVGVDIGVGVGQ